MSPEALPVSPPRSIADMQSCHADLISEATTSYGGAEEAFGISGQIKVELIRYEVSEYDLVFLLFLVFMSAFSHLIRFYSILHRTLSFSFLSPILLLS
jgi:hypothetical protein